MWSSCEHLGVSGLKKLRGRNKSCEPFSFGGNVLLYPADWRGDDIVSKLHIWIHCVSWKGFREKELGNFDCANFSHSFIYHRACPYILWTDSVLKASLVTWHNSTWIRHSICLHGDVQSSGRYRSIKISVMYLCRFHDGGMQIELTTCPQASHLFLMLNWPGACQKSDHSLDLEKDFLPWPNINHFER